MPECILKWTKTPTEAKQSSTNYFTTDQVLKNTKLSFVIKDTLRLHYVYFHCIFVLTKYVSINIFRAVQKNCFCKIIDKKVFVNTSTVVKALRFFRFHFPNTFQPCAGSSSGTDVMIYKLFLTQKFRQKTALKA
jgi:hypothetical protein